jgi:hypothetical protein
MPEDPPPLPASEGEPQFLDPQTILFSIPTISNDLAPMEPVLQRPEASCHFINEDDWSQVEFFPKSQLAEVQRMLRDYKQFEAAHRLEHGWKKAYIRDIARHAVIANPKALDRLVMKIGAQAGPAAIIFSGNSIVGRVANGFTIPLGGNVVLYGYETSAGIEVLGASVGSDPDDRKLTEVFAKLNRDEGLILVDWVQQLVLVSVGHDGQIGVFRP